MANRKREKKKSNRKYSMEKGFTNDFCQILCSDLCTKSTDFCWFLVQFGDEHCLGIDRVAFVIIVKKDNLFESFIRTSKISSFFSFYMIFYLFKRDLFLFVFCNAHILPTPEKRHFFFYLLYIVQYLEKEVFISFKCILVFKLLMQSQFEIKTSKSN